MSVKILYRPAEVVEGEWQTLATVSSAHAAADELASWRWTSPGHGDLVRLVGPSSERLFVFDSAKSGFVEVKTKQGERGWFELWERGKDDEPGMLHACSAVDRRRLVLAACACAETVLRLVPDGEDSPRIAIDTARAWVRGEATLEDVKKARDAAFAVGTEAAAAAAYSAASAAASTAVRPSFYAANAASSAVDAILYDTGSYDGLRSMVPLILRYVPLSVLACSLVGARDPLPLPRSNPSHRRGSRAR